MGCPPQGRSRWTATRRSSRTPAAERARKPRPNCRGAVRLGAPGSGRRTSKRSDQRSRQQWANNPVDFVLGRARRPHWFTLRTRPDSPLACRQAACQASRATATGRDSRRSPTDSPNQSPDIVVDGHAWFSAANASGAGSVARQQDALDSFVTKSPRSRRTSRTRDNSETRSSGPRTQAANEFATSDTDHEMNKLPYFKEQKAEIEKVFRAMPPMPDSPGRAKPSAMRTFRCLPPKCFPTLIGTTQSDRPVRLSTRKPPPPSAIPATGPWPVAARPTSFEEALRQAEASHRR